MVVHKKSTKKDKLKKAAKKEKDREKEKVKEGKVRKEKKAKSTLSKKAKEDERNKKKRSNGKEKKKHKSRASTPTRPPSPENPAPIMSQPEGSREKEKNGKRLEKKASPCKAIEINIVPERRFSDREMKMPQVEPLPPGAKPNPPQNGVEPKDLYKILDEISDSKSKSVTLSAERSKQEMGGHGSNSFELKKTQSLEKSPTTSEMKLVAPIAPGPPSKVHESGSERKGKDLPMESPPKSDKSEKAKVLRSELDEPKPEPGFVKHHGDTVMIRIPPSTPFGHVDCDLIGRAGMYLERFGLPGDKKQAFDWIAYNRHDLNGKEALFSHSLAVALGDIGITKPLLLRTLAIFKAKRQISGPEHDKILREVQTSKDELISFSQMSLLFRQNCAMYTGGPPSVFGQPN